MRKYFIGNMFLHKLDILNRNLNGLFLKFNPVVTKLCAVTKLGDLTVLLILTANEHVLTESWLQIVEVAITSVGMSVQDTALTMFIILP